MNKNISYTTYFMLFLPFLALFFIVILSMFAMIDTSIKKLESEEEFKKIRAKAVILDMLIEDIKRDGSKAVYEYITDNLDKVVYMDGCLCREDSNDRT